MPVNDKPATVTIITVKKKTEFLLILMEKKSLHRKVSETKAVSAPAKAARWLHWNTTEGFALIYANLKSP
jgi:hypothetical protein